MRSRQGFKTTRGRGVAAADPPDRGGRRGRCGHLRRTGHSPAGVAVRYVSHVIDRHRGPVIADLAALAFCDASGLGALVRMAVHAEQAGCSFRLASPSPSLVKIMRITGLYCRFLTVRLLPT